MKLQQTYLKQRLSGSKDGAGRGMLHSSVWAGLLRSGNFLPMWQKDSRLKMVPTIRLYY